LYQTRKVSQFTYKNMYYTNSFSTKIMVTFIKLSVTNYKLWENCAFFIGWKTKSERQSAFKVSCNHQLMIIILIVLCTLVYGNV